MRRCRISKSCEVCKAPFEVTPSKIGYRTCGRVCGYVIRRKGGRPLGSLNRKGRFGLITVSCAECKKSFVRKRSESHVLRCSWRCRSVFFQQRYTGSGNPFFGRTFRHTEYVKKWKIGKGGITPQNRLIRGSEAYSKWRVAIFKRDNYTCQDCGRRGRALNAHHIKPFALFPELRMEISNGTTLCVPCHRKTDSYAGRTRGTIIDI